MTDYINPSLLLAFIPTFFFVAATPGLCMTLSLTLGMTIGVRRTMWMMAGELVGVGVVTFLAAIGVATMMLQYPTAFEIFKYVGGLYLMYTGYTMARSQGKFKLDEECQQVKHSPKQLAAQGFITAIANPKGWAFTISLLPPFISPSLPLMPQLSLLILIILLLEFVCLMAYAWGGKTLTRFLGQEGNVDKMNMLAGGLIIIVGIWLMLS